MTAARPYLDLILEMRNLDLAVGTFIVTLTAPEVGESDPVTVPYRYDELEELLYDLERKRIDIAALIDLGHRLAGRLLPPGQIRELFLRAYQQAGLAGGVRLRLLIRETHLAQLPWEYAYLKLIPRGPDEVRHFLALNPQVSIVRHEALPQPQPALAPLEPGPLRMVAAMANVNAPGYARLNLQRERKFIEEALAAVPEAGIRVTWEAFLEDTTVDRLKLALQTKPALFHFAGHGVMEDEPAGSGTGRGAAHKKGRPPVRRPATPHGAIVLAAGAESRPPVHFPAGQLAAVLQQAGVRIAVLGACYSGRQDGLNPWTGVAPALISVGIPAVVAMQYEVLDEAAIAFNRMFYVSLANGVSIDEAVSAGRLAMWTAARRDEVEWGGPVLYLRALDGVLFPERAADPARAAARNQAHLRIEQQIETLFGQAGGAEIKQMLQGLIEVQQTIHTVGAGGEAFGVTIDQVHGGEVKLVQDVKTIEQGGSLVGVELEGFGTEPGSYNIPPPPPPPDSNTPSQVAPPTAQPEFDLRQLRLDAAVPEQVKLERAFTLAVAIKQPGAPPLTEADLPVVHSGQFQVDWPAQAAYLRLRLQIDAPDCEIHGQATQAFRLYAGQDSPVFYFNLTPKVAGKINIIIKVYQEDDWLGSARVSTLAAAEVVGQMQVSITSHALQDRAEAIAGLQEILTVYRRRLTKLRERQALLGPTADVSLELQIEDIEAKIADLQVELVHHGLSNATDPPPAGRL